MLWLKHKVIAFFGLQQFNYIGPASLARAMFDSVPKVRFPPAEVVIYINDRDTRLLSAPFQAQKLSCHWTGIFQKLIGFWKIKVIDDVDQKQSDIVFVWCTAVQISVFAWYTSHYT